MSWYSSFLKISAFPDSKSKLAEINLRLTTGGNSLVVQWLGLCASTAGDIGFIPGGGTKIPSAAQCGQK